MKWKKHYLHFQKQTENETLLSNDAYKNPKSLLMDNKENAFHLTLIKDKSVCLNILVKKQNSHCNFPLKS